MMDKKTTYTGLAAFNYLLSGFCIIGAFKSLIESDMDAAYGFITASILPNIGGLYSSKKLSETK